MNSSTGGGALPLVPYMSGYTPTYSYDPTSTDPVLRPLSDVRRRLGDIDVGGSTTGPTGMRSVAYSDQEILATLQDNGNDIFYTTIDLILQYANNKAMNAVRVTLGGGGMVDMTQAPGIIREQAQALMDWYASLPADAIVEVNYNDITYRGIFAKNVLRGGY